MAERRAFYTSPYLLLILTTIFWAGNFVVGRATSAEVPPMALTFWRWMVALLLILPFTVGHLRRDWPIIKQSWKLVALLGMLSVAIFNPLIYLGLQTSTATNGVLLQSGIPVFIIGLSWMFFGVRITRVQMLGVLASLVGVVFIVTQASWQKLMSIEVGQGDVWILIAVLSWAFYSILLPRRPTTIHPLSFMFASVAIGVLALLPFYLVEHMERPLPLNWRSYASIAYTAVFASVLAFLFWVRGVAELGPNKAGQFIHLMPVFGLVMSIVFLGEIPQGFHFIGVGLIITGIYLATFYQSKRDKVITSST